MPDPAWHRDLTVLRAGGSVTCTKIQPN